MRNAPWIPIVLTSIALPLAVPAVPEAPAPKAAAEKEVARLLERQTQEMLDAITAGKAAVWQRYLDDRALYTAEDGTVSTKKQMVEGIRPLPAGVSGALAVKEFQATLHGKVAIASYLIDESEEYHGQKLHCRYRTTDTWLETPAGWRLVAGQVLAVREDPPAVAFTEKQLEAYSGRYVLAPDVFYEIRRKGGGLEGQQSGRPAEVLQAEVADVLFVPGRPRYRKIFQRALDGRVTGFIERREAWDLEWKRLP